MKRRDLSYKSDKCAYNFRQFETIRPFSRNISNGWITSNEADIYQFNLLMEILNFRKNSNNSRKKQEKINTVDSLHGIFEVREKVLEFLNYHQPKV